MGSFARIGFGSTPVTARSTVVLSAKFSKAPKSLSVDPNQKSSALPERAAHSHCVSVGRETVLPDISLIFWQKAFASSQLTRTTGCFGRLAA